MKKGLSKFISAVLAACMATSGVMTAQMVTTPSIVMAATMTAQSNGWKETAYTEWLPVAGAAYYEAYVKSASGTYTKLNDALVREYGTFCRADAPGLAAGTYNMKIVAKSNSGADVATWESGAINVESYDRSGFAFSDGGSSSGGYNDDGTPKANAQIFYITDSNKNSITMDVVTDSKGGTTPCVGLGAIIKSLEKKYETRPLIFRFIGQVNDPDSTQSLNQLDIKRSAAPITFEGIGNDAMIKFDLNLVEANNVEVRNLGFKDMTTKDEDAVTIKDGSQRIWVHNNDMFYGGSGSDKDQAKGDGSVDLKGTSTKITVSYNHYWDNGKVNLCGLGENADYEITYSNNWFDHSDSRHPRVRTGSIHIYNNFYDGVAKYGAGACTGSSLFVESNYFRNTSKPVMSSKQGTDAAGDGTFSGETGGIIKMYDNVMVGPKYTYREGMLSDGTYNLDCDGYTVANRTDTLPSEIKTVSGGTSYNNFDTIRDLGVDPSKIVPAKDVPAYVTANSGRIDGGNFKYTFDDSVDDASYAVNAALTAALGSYTYMADTANASGKSATGIDGNTFYTTRDAQYAAENAALATETDTTANTVNGGGSGGGVVAGADLTLDGKTDITAGSYTTNVTGVGTNGAFAILTNSSGSVTVSSSKGIQLGGSGDPATGKRLISINMEKAGTIFVTGSSTGTDVRTINVSDTTGAVKGTIATATGSGVYVDAPGTYYIYSAGSGINITKITASYGEAGETNSTTTTKVTESSTQTTTVSVSSESSSQTSTKVTESSSETSTAVVVDDGYATAGKYVINKNATGGDFNIAEKVAKAGNVNFNLRDITTTGGRVRGTEEGGYIAFEVDKPATITLKVGSGKDIQIRDFSSATIVATYAASATSTVTIPAGSYVIESDTDGSNAEVDEMTIAYDGATPAPIKGDADDNGTVDVADVTMIMNFAVGKISAVTNANNADVTKDSKVDVDDAYVISRFLNHIIDNL